MNVLFSLIAVGLLYFIAVLGTGVIDLKVIFGIVIPYIALAIFIVGFILKVVRWGKSPVPFNIATSCGQQKSLPWIKQNKLESPSCGYGVLARMFLEVFAFRSLFRNTKAELIEDKRLIYSWSMWLWLAALAFHYSFLVVVIRHLRLFAEPVPYPILLLQQLDGFLQIGAPTLFMTSLILLGAVTFLLVRRLVVAEIRYISLISDYFPLLLIIAIAVTGIFMRHFTKVDIIGVKELAIGLISFSPQIPEGVGSLFYAHLFLVCTLMAYLPFSKLMHMGGVFMSPTRNMTCNSREVRHINPWNPDVKLHHYEEYEDEFRDKMKAVGLPLDKED